MEASDKKRILVIEDEPHIAEGLKLNLKLQGNEVEIAPDGASGLKLWREWQPDLIVLDIMLPGVDGLSVLQSIRLEDEQIPILILSAKARPKDRIRGFTYGVDDYLTKPFDLEEFLLRVERLLTRTSWNREEGAPGLQNPLPLMHSYRFGDNRIDFVQSTAQSEQGQISLTEQETKLLKIFILNRGKPVTRKKHLEIGWGYTRRDLDPNGGQLHGQA